MNIGFFVILEGFLGVEIIRTFRDSGGELNISKCCITIRVQLLAAQIIEMHAFLSQKSRFAQSGVEAGWGLWKMATTTNADNLKFSALSALVQIRLAFVIF